MNQLNLANARTWVVKHSKEVIDRLNTLPSQKPVILKMGYGPSGTPHIGTVTELIRTCMVAKALRQLQERPVIVLSFCDDLDGMRKVPPNLPNSELLRGYIGHPLSRIPDPYNVARSFAENNIQKLCSLVQEFGFKVIDYKPNVAKKYSMQDLLDMDAHEEGSVVLLRASDMYESGSYNKQLLEILQNHQKILDIVLPTLGEDRSKSYSPFMPISKKSGKVLETGVLSYHAEDGYILVDDGGETVKVRVENDNCKLQWKIDFAMQWICLGVDYELSGKDIAIGTYPVSRAVLEALGYNPPITPMYEMFLAEDGTRISKTKGNGLSLDDLLMYTSTEVIRHFMFLNPSSAKRLDIKKVPAYVDAFIKDLEAYNELRRNGQAQGLECLEESPIWYSEKVAPANPSFNASTILNVIQGLHPPSVDSVVSFLQDTRKLSLNELDLKFIGSMYRFYHEHHTKPTYESMPENCQEYLSEFIPFLSEDAAAMQTKLYELGNQAVGNGDVSSLKAWFEMLYKCLIGAPQGPRLGSFFALYGIAESEKLIRRAIEKSQF